MRTGNEARVGLVVLIALALTVGGVIYLQGVGLRAQTYYARLEGSAALEPGDEVRLQGVKVGVVQDITLDAQQRPLATLAIARQTPQVRLLKNYRYLVSSSGIIGESFIDVRGTYRSGAGTYLSDNASDPIPVQASGGLLGALQDDNAGLIRDFKQTLTKLNTTMDRVNSGVLSAKTQTKLVQALDGVARLTASATVLTQRAQSTFGPGGVRIGFGDPQSQRALAQTFRNTELASGAARQVVQQAGAAAREATFAAHNLRNLTGSLGGTLNDNRGALRSVLANLNRTANNVAGLTQTLDFTFRQGGFKENAQIAFQSFRRSAENLEATTAGFRTIATDPATQTTLHATLAALQDSVGALRTTAQTLQSTIGDPAVQQSIKGTLQTLNTTAQTLQATTENLRDTAQGLKNVVGDPQVQNDLKAIPSELRGTLEATRGAAERVNSLLGGRKHHSTETGTTTGKGEGKNRKSEADQAPPFGVDVTLRHFIDPSDHGPRDTTGRLYGDVDLKGALLGGPFRLGLSNIGDGTDLTLQSGHFLGTNGDVRYGVYRSKLGLGADYKLGRFSLEGNVWDPNNRSANAYLGFRLTPEVTILAGRENIGNERTNSVAVRLGR